MSAPVKTHRTMEGVETTRRDDERTVPGAHRRMRRADREVSDPAAIERTIADCRIMTMAYNDAEGLTLVPLNFGYVMRPDGLPTLYCHSAAHGRKLDAIRAAGNALAVAVSMRTDCEPIEGRTWCAWGEAFRSVVATGTASIVEDMGERRLGLQRLMAQQAGVADAEFTDAQVRAVTVWKVEIGHMSAKVHARPPRPDRPRQ